MEPTTKEEMDYTLGNQLLAEFMGYEKVRVGYFDDEDPEDGETEWQRVNREWMDRVLLDEVGIYFVNVPLNAYYKEDELNYHKDWNILMEVWYKFRDLRFEEMRDQFMHSDWRTIIGHKIAYNSINDAYKSVIKAINWYNSTKQ